jgi:hypothetical protein
MCKTHPLFWSFEKLYGKKDILWKIFQYRLIDYKYGTLRNPMSVWPLVEVLLNIAKLNSFLSSVPSFTRSGREAVKDFIEIAGDPRLSNLPRDLMVSLKASADVISDSGCDYDSWKCDKCVVLMKVTDMISLLQKHIEWVERKPAPSPIREEKKLSVFGRIKSFLRLLITNRARFCRVQ